MGFLSRKNKHGKFYLEIYKVLMHKLEAYMEMADYLAQVQIDILKTDQPNVSDQDLKMFMCLMALEVRHLHIIETTKIC